MNDSQSFVEAVKAGAIDKVKATLTAQPSLANAADEDGNSVVLLAAYYGQKATLRELLSRGPALNLFEASAVGDLDRVRALTREDPDVTADLVNAFAHDGFTPLGLACFFGHADVAEYLLSTGAEVNVASRNRMRVMPIHSAVAGRHIGIVKTLLEHGADVNAAQQDGFAPLHGAAQNGQSDMAELLLAYGAEVNAQNAVGQTPLSIATHEGHQELADLLRAHGAGEV